MSGLDSSSGQEPLQHDSDELARLLEQVEAAAKRVARQNGIPDHEEDLVQAAMLNLLTSHQASGPLIGQDEIERVIKKLAAKEVYRRRTQNSWRARQATALRDHAARNPLEIHRAPINRPPVTPSKRKGIPTLCVRFVRLADGTGQEADMALRVLAAATVEAHDPKVLRAQQHRVFSLAYFYEGSIDSIAALLGTSPGAVTQRLQRIVRRLESALIESVAHRLDPASMAMLREGPDQASKKNQKSLSLVRAEACVNVLGALERCFGEKRPNRTPRR